MAGKTYIGVGGVARKVKNIYVGVNGVARKVKKVYVGVGGIARPCWSSEPELTYYGTASGLSDATMHSAATSIGNYALVMGGYFGSAFAGVLGGTSSSMVDAYSSTLTHSKPTALSFARYSIAAATIGNYALAAGGHSFDSSDIQFKVDAYNSALTHSLPTDLHGGGNIAISLGNYVIVHPNGNYFFASVYDSALTRLGAWVQVDVRADGMAGTAIGNYALFMGGRTSSYISGDVTAINSALTFSMPTPLNTARAYFAAKTIGNHALAMGGLSVKSVETDSVETFDSALTLGTATALSSARQEFSATKIGNYVLAMGGENYINKETSSLASVDVYDSALTRSAATELSIGRSTLTSVTVGNYALAAGGCSRDASTEGGRVNTVDVYTITQS